MTFRGNFVDPDLVLGDPRRVFDADKKVAFWQDFVGRTSHPVEVPEEMVDAVLEAFSNNPDDERPFGFDTLELARLDEAMNSPCLHRGDQHTDEPEAVVLGAAEYAAGNIVIDLAMHSWDRDGVGSASLRKELDYWIDVYLRSDHPIDRGQFQVLEETLNTGQRHLLQREIRECLAVFMAQSIALHGVNKCDLVVIREADEAVAGWRRQVSTEERRERIDKFASEFVHATRSLREADLLVPCDSNSDIPSGSQL